MWTWIIVVVIVVGGFLLWMFLGRKEETGQEDISAAPQSLEEAMPEETIPEEPVAPESPEVSETLEVPSDEGSSDEEEKPMM